MINEDLNIGIHPPPTVGLIIQTVGNQRGAASIWQTDYGDGKAGLICPAHASPSTTARQDASCRGAAHESQQAQSTEAAPTPSTRGLARSTSMPRWPAWSTDSCSQSAAPGSAAWATRSWPRLPSR